MPTNNNIRQTASNHTAGTIPVTRTTARFACNSDSLVAADSALIPALTLLGTDSAHADVYRLSIPKGGNYLTLTHEWTILVDPGTDTDPTTLPVVRIFGRLPSGPTVAQDCNNSFKDNFDAGGPAIVMALGDWQALGNMNNGTFQIELGSLAAPTAAFEYIKLGDIFRQSIPISVHLRGCEEAIVLIETATVGPSSGRIIGTIED